MKSTENTIWEEACKRKWISPHNLEKRLKDLREGKTLVTINGSFDLLHPGHLYMLHQAKQFGDLLLVLLNTDRSIRSYKGGKRPILSLSYRAQFISALEFVDYVTWFDEDDPRELLSVIRPDIHANGEEYGEECIEAEVVKQAGGLLQLIRRIPNLSTSDLIEKIQKL